MTTSLCPINRRILVIDDTPAIHEDFRKILSAEHSPTLAALEAELFEQPQEISKETRFELTSAYQGQQGLEAVLTAQGENRPFAMAFVDVRMPPGWDGIETVSRIWESAPDLEIVICTAHSDYSWDEITNRLGKPERLLILKKPFDVIEVMQLANTLTEKWRLSQTARANLRSLEHAVQQRTRELQIVNHELSLLAVERQRSAERVERANRLYSVLSKINELIVRSRSSQALFEEACRILVEDGHFLMAWFGVLDSSSDSLHSLACAGFEDGYLNEFAFSTDPDSPFSSGPVGQALFHGSVGVCNDVSEDPEFVPWRGPAEKRGYGSVASLPVKSGHNVFGALTLYSSEPHFFNQAEQELLERLSADLSFANQFIEHELRLRLQSAALTAAENSIVITDPKAVILWANPSFSKLTGYSEEAVLGQTMSILKSGKHPADFYRQVWQAICSGVPWHGEMINRRADGTLFSCESTITPLHNDRSEITHFIAIQRDVTARNQAEARVHAFANLGKSLNVANTTHDAAKIIVEAADLLLGWDACFFKLHSPEDGLVVDVLAMDMIDGRRMEVPIDKNYHPPTEVCAKALQQGGVLLLRDRPSQMRPEGIPFGDTNRPSASLLFVPIRNGRSAVGVLSIQSYSPRAYDQSSLETLQALADHCGGALNRIKALENLKMTQEQLRQSQKLEAIGQLAGGVAHDFNNLLAVIRGNSDLILMNGAPLQDEARECLRHISQATERAANLTNQLLIFGRKQLMQARPIDLNELVNNLTRMLKRIIGEHINLQCDYAAQTPFVEADTGMLEQVLVNLVVNARDAMPKGGRLTVGTGITQIENVHLRNQEARPGKFCVLSVQDSGTGIPPEVLGRIFEPFFTTKEVGKGTGLGLSTAYGIVKQHQGWIEVSTQLGTGSVFTVYLPSLSRPAPKIAQSIDGGIPSGGSERILLVEDEDGVRALSKRVLEKFGYQVTEASSGCDALAEFQGKEEDFDLLLTDMVMPGGLSGRELAEHLKSKNPALKVLFTSGYNGENLGQDTEFLRQTQSEFIPKPCSPHQLLKAVRKCLDHRWTTDNDMRNSSHPGLKTSNLMQ